MSGSMYVNLRGGEKLYLNGAVIRTDRRVTIEIMNDVTFLLASHVLQPEQATTPLKQLYFVVQSALMDPAAIEPITAMTSEMLARTIDSFENEEVLEGLRKVADLIARGKRFEALRSIRALYPLEEKILGPGKPRPEQAA